MKRSTVDLLCCPGCQGALALRAERLGDVVDEGDLSCLQCERRYPIKEGIVHFIHPEELEGLNRRFARFYDRFSRFEAILSKLASLAVGGERKARTEILRRLEPGGRRTLEVSIGSGCNLPYLLESPDVGDVYGLDMSPAQLGNCRRLVSARGWPVDLFLGVAEALPFRTESFDCVFHVGGINFFSDRGKAIGEMIRVARPGTRIVIVDESERAARLMARFLRLSRWNQGREVDVSVPVHLVPETMEEVRVAGLWRRHGHDHAYCLEFRKPAR